MSGFDKARERAFPTIDKGQTVIDVRADINRTPAYDPVERAHLWVVFPCYRVDLDKIYGTGMALIGVDTLLAIGPPVCWYCEEMADNTRRHQPCPGDPADKS